MEADFLLEEPEGPEKFEGPVCLLGALELVDGAVPPPRGRLGPPQRWPGPRPEPPGRLPFREPGPAGPAEVAGVPGGFSFMAAVGPVARAFFDDGPDEVAGIVGWKHAMYAQVTVPGLDVPQMVQRILDRGQQVALLAAMLRQTKLRVFLLLGLRPRSRRDKSVGRMAHVHAQ